MGYWLFKRVGSAAFLRRLMLAVAFSFSHYLILPLQAGLREKYTKDRPLIIASDWDFAPYEYLGSGSTPEGFNVDLLTNILESQGIPFKFEMNDWTMAVESFATHKADVIIDHAEDYVGQAVSISKLPVHYYQVKVISRPGAASMEYVKSHQKPGTMAVKDGDYAMRYMLKGSYPSLKTVFRSPKAAIVGIANGQLDYFVWGEEPLKWKLKTLHIEGLQLDSIAIPTSRMHLISYDPELVLLFDDRYARLRQQGELQLMTDKWFHPERRHNNAPVTILLVVLAIAIIVIVVSLLSRLTRFRVRRAVEHSKDMNYMMKQALSLSDSMVILQDMKENRITNEYGNLLPEGSMSSEELAHRLAPGDRETYLDTIAKVKEGQLNTHEINCKLNIGTDEDPNWIYLQGIATADLEEGKPRFIINMLRNVTREREEERQNREMGLRFYHLFDINLIPMAFYDPTGKLVNLNQQMRKLCKFDEKGERYFRETNLFEAAMFKDDILPGFDGVFYSCQHMDYPEMAIDKYIELKILPHYDDHHRIIYYVVSAIDVTHHRELHMELRRYEKELQKASIDINHYEEQLHYLLENCDMYVWQFDLSSRQISFSRSLKQVDFSMSREEYINCMVEEEREGADHNLVQMIKTASPFSAVHRFSHTPVNPEPCWYVHDGIPYFNANGQMQGYFGVCRDVTQLMEAQEQLRRETQRAENSGLQKSAFLANMTHEIRTPLNAIVGFSDLLPMTESQEEKQEFIRIIRNNCDMLLRLINDILEASNLDSRPLTITPVDVDFAQAFDDICQTLEQRVQEPGIRFIKDNPFTTLPTYLDKGRMQQVLTNFVTNAVKYTHEGHIRVGYRCTSRPGEFTGGATPPQTAPAGESKKDGQGLADTGILMYCEDTGAGIPKEKQSAVFDRFVKLNEFVQGTGLGLSICKSIAERSNGAIGVSSDGPGHGSTFWIWIPCQLPASVTLSPADFNTSA